MKISPNDRKSESVLWSMALLVPFAIIGGLPGIQRAQAATNVVIWDTSSPFADTFNVANRAGWIPVPRDIVAMEADPPKASSDPGYYGREYSFKGDAVVENRRLTAVFWSATGRLVIYSKTDEALPSD